MHLSMYRCIFFYTFVYMEPICVNAYGNCLWMHVSKLTSLNDMDNGLVIAEVWFHMLFFLDKYMQLLYSSSFCSFFPSQI